MKKKKRKIKVAGAGLEGFVEWVDLIASDLVTPKNSGVY